MSYHGTDKGRHPMKSLAKTSRRIQGRYAEAEPLYKRGLAITEKALGPDHPHVGAALNNLAALYFDQGRYAEAELLFRRDLIIAEKALGPDHLDVAQSLRRSAALRSPAYRRALLLACHSNGDQAHGSRPQNDEDRCQGQHRDTQDPNHIESRRNIRLAQRFHLSPALSQQRGAREKFGWRPVRPSLPALQTNQQG
jgi:tetratricopeptide (TPR) repeat protein